MICSHPRSTHSTVFPDAYRSGRTALELVPQGTLAERIRAGAPAFPPSTRRPPWAPLGEGMERRSFDGREYLLAYGVTADFALIKGRSTDRHGNVVYNKTARNFGPLMATAATTTIVQVSSMVPVGELDPEVVVTPGIFVNRVVHVADPAHESVLVAQGASYP